MDSQFAIDLSREALWTALMLGGPLLLVAVVVALAIGILQAVTQIQDPTLTVVPKIVAVVAAVGLCLPWLVQRMVEYAQPLFSRAPWWGL